MRINPPGAEVDPSSPRAWATCDRCGFQLNHYKLRWQHDWRGAKLANLKFLVCETCLDEPQRQLGILVLPPDPMPIMNARPEQYSMDEVPYSTRYTMDGNIRMVIGSEIAGYPNRLPQYSELVVISNGLPTPTE